MSGEVELKLEVNPRYARRLMGHSLLRGAPARQASQLTVYYDTAKGALRKLGFSLRVRSANGAFIQTVKPAAECAGLFARDEWEFPVDSIEPDTAKLAELPLEPLRRAGKLDKLKPVVRSKVRRTSWRLEHGKTAFQVDLDEGEIRGGGQSERLCELELELIDGDAAALIEAARLFADRVPMRIGVMSKVERGLALADGSLGRVHKAGSVVVHDKMTVADAFTVVAHACIRHYRLNEPLVIAKQQPAALHQSRVAMRRLRSAFTLFGPAIRDSEYDRLREELRWFTAQLGDARNLDVYLERELADDVRRALMVRRERAYRRVIRAMQSQRQRSLMLDLVGWVAAGDWRSARRARRPVTPFAVRRLDKLWSTVARPAALLGEMDEEARHRLRIQIKKLRYAVEFLRGVFPDAAKRQKQFTAAAAGLQEALGKLNDLTTARVLELPGEASDDGSSEEEEHLAESESLARQLTTMGPFWLDEDAVEGDAWPLPAAKRHQPSNNANLAST